MPKVTSILRRYVMGLEIFRRQGERRSGGGRRRSTTMTFTLPEYSTAAKSILKTKLESPTITRNGPTTNGADTYQMVPVVDGNDGRFAHDDEEGLV